MLTLEALPAAEGDALWIEWGEDKTYRMLIDMGRSAHGKKIRERLEALDSDDRVVELLILTHVDQDHIQGALEAFAKEERASGTTFKDIWFNGWNHLHGLHYSDTSPPFSTDVPQQPIGDGTQSFGAVQAELLTPWVKNSGVWNKAFDGNPVVRPETKIGEPISLKGGLSITVLGPTQSILEEFIDEWGDKLKTSKRNMTCPSRTI